MCLDALLSSINYVHTPHSIINIPPLHPLLASFSMTHKNCTMINEHILYELENRESAFNRCNISKKGKVPPNVIEYLIIILIHSVYSNGDV